MLVVAIGAWSAWRMFAPGATSSASANPAEDAPLPQLPAVSAISEAEPAGGAIEAPSLGGQGVLGRSPPSASPTSDALATPIVDPPLGQIPAKDASAKPPDPSAATVGGSPSSITEPRVVTLDDRFIVRGSGTESDPLRIPWELLMSAQETYDPPAGKTELPSRVTQLSGQFVKITGYFAAGVLEDETRDLIVMLNKWDGCCLGVPPTPFDAVEVRLAEPVRLRGKHMVRYGTVTGRFEVSPFLVAGWLMSVYRIEDAKLEWGG